MLRKILPFVIAVSILCNFSVYAQTQEIKTYWAKDTLDKFLSMGLIKGDENGEAKPEALITRAEYCAVINNICNLSEKKSVDFIDVKEGNWYKDTFEIAYNEGYISGYEENGVKFVLPKNLITREQAAVIVCKVFELDEPDVKLWRKINDEDSISDYAKRSVEVLLNLQYTQGYPDGTFRPKGNLTRAEAFTILDNICGKINGYGAETDKKSTKNLTVCKPGTVVNGMDIENDVFITAGVMDGEVTFKNVNVGGRVVIKGGGQNSIRFENSNINKVIVNKKDGKISVKASGKTNVANMLCKTGAKIIEENIDTSSQGFKTVEIYEGIAAGFINSFVGNFEVIKAKGVSSLEIAGGTINQLELYAKSYVNISKGAIIGSLNALSGAGGSEISNNGQVLAGKIDADGISINSTVQAKGTLTKSSSVVSNTSSKNSSSGSNSSGNNSSDTIALSVQHAYINDGKLYVKYNKNPNFEIKSELTVKDEYAGTTVSGAVYYSGNFSHDNTAEFYLSNGTETVPFCEGSYNVTCGSTEYPVLSFATIDVPITNSVYASVYQCVYNPEEYSLNISILGSDASIIDVTNLNGDISIPDGSKPLQNGDILKVFCDGKEIFKRIWDQWSKIWSKEPSNSMEMIPVEGGEYNMGDYMQPLYAYTYPTYDMNLKKPKEVMPEEAKNNSTHEFWDITFDERDQHIVKVNDFYIGKYEVTFELFDQFCEETSRNKKNDYDWGRGYRPVVDITWYDAIEFCNWLSEKEGFDPCYTIENLGEIENVMTMVEKVDGSGNTIKAVQPMTHEELKVTCDFSKNGYRLPTEAEYEYAAKGGSSIGEINDGKGNIFNGVSNLNSLIYYAWNKDNVDNPTVTEENPKGKDGALADSFSANGYTAPVGQLLPNDIGAYDMSGNVWEWMWDYYDPEYYSQCEADSAGGCTDNPKGYTYEQVKNERSQEHSGMGKYAHVLRGGCWANPSPFLFTFFRFFSGQQYGNNIPNFTDARIGFRLCRTKVD